MIVHPNPLEVAAAEATLTDAPTEVVMDDMVDSAKAINEASEQLGEISRNVEDLGNAAVSVEAYMNSFLDAFSAEDWSPKIAHQYQIGMEAILKATNSQAPATMFCASFEAAGVTQTHEENRSETKGKSEGVIKRLWAAFLKLIDQLWDKTQDFITFFGKSAGALRKSASNLKARVTEMQSGGRKYEYPAEMKPGPWASYRMGAGSGSEAIEKLAAKVFAFSDTWYDTYLNAIRKLADSGSAPELKLSKDTAKRLEAEVNELLEPKLKKAGGEWPGGYTVAVDRQPNQLDRFTVKVTATAGALGTEIPTLSMGNIMELANSINEAASMVEHEVQQMYKGRETLKKVKADIEKAIKSGEKGVAPDAVKLAGALVGDTTLGPRTVLPLINANCIKAAKHANASLALFKLKK